MVAAVVAVPHGVPVPVPHAEAGAAAGVAHAEAAVVAAERDAALQPGEAAAVVRDAVQQPAAAAVRDAVLRRAAGPSVAALSAFHRGQALPWLAP
ncbi:hypothetical protein [Afipia sp. GAS231]|uniref:hypothetical protein n=1 Tax=Afipia sp. GAS231 TaxID=1882747 RepID=UPI00087C244C|nr:hypothetical protein [Afipia sp. GAS231]SDO26143.1 hypothetical protein SAMN05444050_3685 [Afipia sp. GAS231]